MSFLKVIFSAPNHLSIFYHLSSWQKEMVTEFLGEEGEVTLKIYDINERILYEEIIIDPSDTFLVTSVELDKQYIIEVGVTSGEMFIPLGQSKVVQTSKKHFSQETNNTELYVSNFSSYTIYIAGELDGN